MKNRPNIISMPKEIDLYNGSNNRCDTLNGPCSCGAWHSKIEIFNKISSQFNITLDEFDSLCIE